MATHRRTSISGVVGVGTLALTAVLAACASSAVAPEVDTAVPVARTSTAVSPRSPTSSPTITLTPTPSTGTPTPSPSANATASSGALNLASITLSAVGDISLAREVVDRMNANGANYPYALITPLVDGQVVFANLEGALTDRGEPWPKAYNFRTPTRFVNGLSGARFGVVSLANNHTMDYGVVGLQDTILALDSVNVAHCGAGNTAAQAHAPAVLHAGTLTVAFLCYAATPTEGGGFDIDAWAAGTDAPGIAIGTTDAIVADVAAARSIADFVIVAVHAGSEYITTPNDTQRELARAALAAGADAYIGAHAHVVQPVEQHGAQLIAWGLGNFIFDLDNVDLANIPEPRVSAILDVTLTKGAGVTTFHAIPVTQDAAEDRPRPSTADEAAILQQLIGR